MSAAELPKAEKPPRDSDGQLLCSYCGLTARLLKSSGDLYNGRDYGPVWYCDVCQAWVGCHKVKGGGFKPLGRLANKELRQAKMAAHAAFDPLWQSKMRRFGCSQKTARRAGYQWLAEQLGISADICHIGMMNVAMCQQVVALCTPPFGLSRIIAAAVKDAGALSEQVAA